MAKNVKLNPTKVLFWVALALLILLGLLTYISFRVKASSITATPDSTISLSSGTTKKFSAQGGTVALKCTDPSTPVSFNSNGNITSGQIATIANIKGSNMTISVTGINSSGVERTTSLLPGRMINVYPSEFSASSGAGTKCEVRFNGFGTLFVTPNGGTLQAELFSGATVAAVTETAFTEHTFTVDIQKPACQSYINVGNLQVGIPSDNVIYVSSESPSIDKTDGTITAKLNDEITISGNHFGASSKTTLKIKDPLTYGTKINVTSDCLGTLTAVQAQ